MTIGKVWYAFLSIRNFRVMMLFPEGYHKSIANVQWLSLSRCLTVPGILWFSLVEGATQEDSSKFFKGSQQGDGKLTLANFLERIFIVGVIQHEVWDKEMIKHFLTFAFWQSHAPPSTQTTTDRWTREAKVFVASKLYCVAIDEWLSFSLSIHWDSRIFTGSFLHG